MSADAAPSPEPGGGPRPEPGAGPAPRALAVPRLHAVTNDELLADPRFPELARSVLAAGGPGLALHLRAARLSGRDLWERAASLASEARARGAVLLVNDRVDVALGLEGVGAHLGGRSLPPAAARRLLGPGRLLGVSVHDGSAASAAAREGANHLFVGTVFATASHPGRTGIGVEGFRRIRERAPGVPALAIGGVLPEHARALLDAGAHGVAAIGGIWRRDDPARAVAEYLEALNDASHRRETA